MNEIDVGPCNSCGARLPTADGYDVRLDYRREYAIGSNDILRTVCIGRRTYCPSCAASAPKPIVTTATVATKEQADYLTPIYARIGFGPIKEFDELPPRDPRVLRAIDCSG